MSDTFRRVFSEAVKKAEERQWVYGLLGRRNVDGTFTYNVPGRRGFIYVTIRQSNGAQTVVPARNDASVEHSANLGVRMKLEKGVYVIWGKANRSDLVNTPTSPDYGIVLHAASHQDGGSDEIATLTPAPFAIPKADASGLLDDWITPTGFTQEEIEDFVAAQFIGNTGTIDATYDDGTGAITLTLDVSVADRYLYSTAEDTWAEGTITAFARGLLDDADAAAMRTTLELIAGGAGDIWVEKAGDTMSGNLRVDAAIGVNTAPATPFHSYANDTSVGGGVLVEQAGTGDAIVQFLLTGVRRWVMGIDNSDGDSFKISPTADVGSSPFLAITTGGNFGINQGSPQWPTHITGTSAGDKLVLLTLHNNSDSNDTEAAIRFVNRSSSITSEAFRVGELSVASRAAASGISRMLARLTNGSALTTVWSSDADVFYHLTPVGILADNPQSPLTVVSTDATLANNANQIELRSERTTINAVGEGLIGGISFRSDDTGITAPGSIAAMFQAVATETQGSTALGTALRFLATPNAQTTPVEMVRIAENKLMVMLTTAGASRLGLKAGDSSNDAAVGGLLYSMSTVTGNVGSSEYDLATYTLPADSLNTNNQRILIDVWGQFAGNGNSKVVRFYIDSTLIVGSFSHSTSVAAGWRMQIEIIRTGSTSAAVLMSWQENGLTYINRATPAVTWSGARVLDIRTDAVNDNDVILNSFEVSWQDYNT